MEKCCYLIGWTLRHLVNMVVLRQFVVNGGSEVLSLCSLVQCFAVYIIGRLDDLTPIYKLDVFTFVWVEHHLPVFFTFLKLV